MRKIFVWALGALAFIMVLALVISVMLKALTPVAPPVHQLWYSYDVTYMDKDQVICYSQFVTDTGEVPQVRRPVGWSCLPLDQTHAQWRYPTYIPPTPTPDGQ